MSRITRLGSNIGGMIDGAVLKALRHRFTRRPSVVSPQDQILAEGADVDRRAALVEAIEHYERPDVQASFYPTPALPDVAQKKQGVLERGRVLDLTWPSAYEPSLPAIRDHYLSYERNRVARARLFMHDVPARTLIICLHGYQGGSFFIEERAFQARWLYTLGADVALFTLPFHGLRHDAGAPSWPSPNVVRTTEGFGQAIYDLRALVLWLRARNPQLAVAACGMSLGGYTAALWATIDALDFLAPIIPVASWAEMMWSHGHAEHRALAERDGIDLPLLQRAMKLVSPLDREPKVLPSHVLVQSARGDKIAPPEQAERLAQHFSGVHLGFTGGHVLQLGRRDAFVALAQRLALVGLIDRRS